jgi:ADP-heptose:LPS heptosyltransferase
MKILIIRFSALGDLVTFEPHFRAIRKCFENAEIDFLTTNLGKALYTDSTYFDNYIIYSSFFGILNQLKEKKYDLIINLQCNKISHYLTFLTPSLVKVNLSSNIIQKIFKLKHHTKNIEEMLIAAKCDELIINNYVTNSDNLNIYLPFKKEITNLNFNNNLKTIGISTGSSEKWLSKKWGIENYKNLIKELLDKKFNIVIIGTKLELDDSTKILKDIHNDNLISFVDKTTLIELKSLISKFDLFIGNDSGPAHISAGLGVNTITIFGSTDIKHCVKNLPYLGIHKCIKPKNSVTCHPCYKSSCPTNMECMKSTTVEDVINEINNILGTK